MAKDSFKTRLEIAKNKAYRGNSKENDKPVSSLGTAFKLSTELVAAVAVGTIIGFILDNWFDTKPLFTICFFLIGVVAGILNVFKSAKRMQKNLKK